MHVSIPVGELPIPSDNYRTSDYFNRPSILRHRADQGTLESYAQLYDAEVTIDDDLIDAQVRAVIEGISNMVDVEAVVPGGPGAIVSAVRGADVQLRVLVVDLIVS